MESNTRLCLLSLYDQFQSLKISDPDPGSFREIFCRGHSIVFGADCCRAVIASFHIGCEVAFLSYYSLGIDAQGPPHDRFSNFVEVDASENDASADKAQDDVCQYPDN